MTDDYAGYNGIAAVEGVERLGCWAHARRKFIEGQKAQPRGKTGRADMALNLINKLYGVERAGKHADDSMGRQLRQQKSEPMLQELKSLLDKTQPHIAPTIALGRAISYLSYN